MASLDVENHPGRLCRLCAQTEQEGKLAYIFCEIDDNQDNIADIINISLPVKVSQLDLLPKQICHLCLEKLQATHEFALSCLAAEQELRGLISDKKFQLSSNFRAPKKDSRKLDQTKSLSKDGSDAELISDVHDQLEEKSKSKDLDFLEKIENENSAFSAKYCCPLCCEGKMGTCSEEPIELNVLKREHPSKSFEEELMYLYERANEDNDSSSSVVEEESDSDDDESNDVVSDVQPSTAKENDSKSYDTPDEEFKVPVRRKHKHVRKKPTKKGAKLKQKLSKSHDQSETIGSVEENDTLIWIEAENEQSIPLVQCIHCCGWLPGYASCLQHSLTSHVNMSESEKRSFLCARCENVSMPSPSDLAHHFKEVHCPDQDFEIEENNGQFIVADQGFSNITPGVENIKDIVYFCCICDKGFSWLLSLLRHSCSQVNCKEMYCNICDQQYRNRQRFVFHMNFHSEKAPQLKCDLCHKCFVDDSELYDHVRFAHITENVVCGECGRDFRSAKGLVSHQLSVHCSDPAIRNRYKCAECGKRCRDKQGLKDHLVTHMSEKPFPCGKCDRAYNRYSRLKQHQMSHLYTDSMECYECTNCGLAFPDVEKAILHASSDGHEVQAAVLNKIYRCEFCDTVFSCPDGLNQHRPSHVGNKPYECNICKSSFSTYSRVTTHKTTHGKYDQIEPLQGDFTIPRHFLCEHCGLSYPYWSYLQTHRKMRHSENPYALSCKFCPEKFKNSWSLIYHRKKVHDENGSVKEWRKRSLQCPQCGVTCAYQHSLSMHIERKHGGSKDEDGKRESYQCEECGKVFKYQSSLLLHQKIHLGQRNHPCGECDKDFLTISTLRNHIKRCHQGIKPHQCEFCGKTFFHRITRDDHLRVHTGEKPFKCQFCEKRFRLKSMLADHSKIHGDHRPYPCDVCGQSFRRMVHMKQHRMLHTGEKPYQCRCCGQDFRLKQELQRHMKTKHGELSIDNVEEDEFIFAD